MDLDGRYVFLHFDRHIAISWCCHLCSPSLKSYRRPTLYLMQGAASRPTPFFMVPGPRVRKRPDRALVKVRTTLPGSFVWAVGAFAVGHVRAVSCALAIRGSFRSSSTSQAALRDDRTTGDRKSTRLYSSHSP